MTLVRHVLDWRSIDELVDPLRLVRDVERAVAELQAPPRVTFTSADRWFGVMPVAGSDYYVVKLVGVYPRNREKGLPLVRGLLIVIDAEAGDVLLAADAAAATAWRTAAATLLAVTRLGARKGLRVGVIGAGVQARYHLRLIDLMLEPSEVMVYSRTFSRAKLLAEEYGGRVASLYEVLRRSDLVVAATSSTRPVVLGELLSDGVIVASVGAPRPVHEVDTRTVVRAGCVVADTRQGVLNESDEIDGLAEVVELGELVRGEKNCRWKDVALYKSVGTAVLDYAVAVHLIERLRLSS